MTAVKVGQVWQYKDKRRGTLIEILRVDNNSVVGLVVGTEVERTYNLARLVSKWNLETVKAEVKAAAPKNWQLKAVCVQNEDVKVRFTKRISEVYGMPLCPCHKQPMVFTEGH